MKCENRDNLARKKNKLEKTLKNMSKINNFPQISLNKTIESLHNYYDCAQVIRHQLAYIPK